MVNKLRLKNFLTPDSLLSAKFLFAGKCGSTICDYYEKESERYVLYYRRDDGMRCLPADEYSNECCWKRIIRWKENGGK